MTSGRELVPDVQAFIRELTSLTLRTGVYANGYDDGLSLYGTRETTQERNWLATITWNPRLFLYEKEDE